MLEINIERLSSYQKGFEKGFEKVIEKGFERGFEKGIEKGKQRKAVEIAQKLLAMNLSLEQIAAITQLPLAEIELLKK